jgi:hypothetical protein
MANFPLFTTESEAGVAATAIGFRHGAEHRRSQLSDLSSAQAQKGD